MQNLIYTLSKENPLWSAERIRDTLLLLNYNPPCNDTIGKYMYKPKHTSNIMMHDFIISIPSDKY